MIKIKLHIRMIGIPSSSLPVSAYIHLNNGFGETNYDLDNTCPHNTQAITMWLLKDI